MGSRLCQNKYKQSNRWWVCSKDEYIIKKISNNTFNTIEELKSLLQRIKDKATKGLTTLK